LALHFIFSSGRIDRILPEQYSLDNIRLFYTHSQQHKSQHKKERKKEEGDILATPMEEMFSGGDDLT
jgi:hypothetical protein